MEEELEVLDLQDLIENQSSLNIEKLFKKKLSCGYRITVMIKQLFSIQTKKNQLFSKIKGVYLLH